MLSSSSCFHLNSTWVRFWMGSADHVWYAL